MNLQPGWEFHKKIVSNEACDTLRLRIEGKLLHSDTNASNGMTEMVPYGKCSAAFGEQPSADKGDGMVWHQGVIHRGTTTGALDSSRIILHFEYVNEKEGVKQTRLTAEDPFVVFMQEYGRTPRIGGLKSVWTRFSQADFTRPPVKVSATMNAGSRVFNAASLQS